MISQITAEHATNLKKKFDAFDKGIKDGLPVLGYLMDDPSLFAYHFFKDRENKQFKVFPYQDLILNDKNKNVFVCIARQSGKSTLAAILALHYAFFHDNVTVVVVSATKAQSKELILRMKHFLNTSRFTVWKHIMPRGKDRADEIELRNKSKTTYSRVISVPATDAGRGYTADVVIGDELAFWENGMYMFNQVVEPMTNYTKGKIIGLTTPNGKQGIAWELYNNPFYSVYQFDWRVCPVNTEEEMEKKRKTRTRAEFATEYEAKFTESKNAYFSHDDIKNSIENLRLGVPGEGVYAMGVDFGKIKDNAVIMVGKVRNAHDSYKEQVIEVVERIVKPLGTNYDAIVAEIKQLHRQFRTRIIFVDQTGVGEGPTDFLRAEGLPVEPVALSLQRKASLLGNLKLLFEQKRIKIPNERDLVDQLELFEYEFTMQGNIQLHAPEGGHDDEVIALALMAAGLSTEYVPVGCTIV